MKLLAMLTTLALASTALSAQVTITNNCGSTIYLKKDAQAFTAPISAIAPAATHVAPLAGMGNAWKFAYNNDAANPIEFDFSVNDGGPVYYDVSDIPGHPFDLAALPNDRSCNVVGCVGNCRKTEACPVHQDFVVKAC